MQIVNVDIQNFRKLKSCRVEFSKEQTVFVGANNSGKTSAMDALILFLRKSKNLATTDFTLSNWSSINQIGENWVANANNGNKNFTNKLWEPFLPSVDIWLKVEDNEVHYVSHIIPSLDWSGGLLGIRLILEPKKVEDLCKAYLVAFTSAKDTVNSGNAELKEGKKISLKLWPASMREFLEKELHKHFLFSVYVLDPSKYNGEDLQSIPLGSEPLDGDPFKGLFKINIINAQRGFQDPNSEEGSATTDRSLSSQLRQYFDRHLDPTVLPDASDLDALVAIDEASKAFDGKLKKSFSSAIGELEELNYPGFSDPQIVLSSKVNPLESLSHDTAVQFNVVRDKSSLDLQSLYLPEKYNGLGYQNLISMVFNLIRFRDEWMNVGKAGKSQNEAKAFIEPLHLVLIEEPEAHLHAQVQQVFIKKAFNVLRNHPNLGIKKQFSTQMVISTHSSHIAHEIDFTCLRYFRRKQALSASDVPCASVVNLAKTFGSDTDTSKFATRYLQTTHCDLFFADAVILVEGSAEKMLIPHFIRCHFSELDKSYITLLEIGGSHAHRLKPLIELLGLLTLVVTDLDSVCENTPKKVLPELGKNYRTGNETIKNWAPCKTQLDEVLNASSKDKESLNGDIRIAYQGKIIMDLNDGKKEIVIPYTFEDALVLSNLYFFKTKENSTGLIKKMSDAVNKPNLSEACEGMFQALKNGKKAEMALDLLFSSDPKDLQPPAYIVEGLEWLKNKLMQRNKEYANQNITSGDVE